MVNKDEEIEEWEDYETIDEAHNEIRRLRGLLARCEPWMLILEDTWSAEAEFCKLIDEVKNEIIKPISKDG